MINFQFECKNDYYFMSFFTINQSFIYLLVKLDGLGYVEKFKRFEIWFLQELMWLGKLIHIKLKGQNLCWVRKGFDDPNCSQI